MLLVICHASSLLSHSRNSFTLTLFSQSNRYTEKLYLMDGLTTYFEHPMSPRPGLSLSYFDLPEGANVYLCPQTLYKLHPDFDKLIIGILTSDPSGIVVFPQGQREEYTQSIMSRLLSKLDGKDGEDIKQRIHFVRRMDFDEFIALAELSNVVLDPFPVGGGRSSFEIFR